MSKIVKIISIWAIISDKGAGHIKKRLRYFERAFSAIARFVRGSDILYPAEGCVALAYVTEPYNTTAATIRGDDQPFVFVPFLP